MTDKKIIVVDTETTGFDPINDEILQIGITDEDGNILYNKYFKPEHVKEWPQAEIVNGISPSMVENEPHLKDCIEEVKQIFRNADIVVGYNTNFDFRFLKTAGVRLRQDTRIVDVMLSFAPVMGVPASWNAGGRQYKGYRCQKLITAADYYGYDWSSYSAHDAIGDAKATAFVLKKIMEEEPELLTDEEWLQKE